MAQYGTTGIQTINPGESVIFNVTNVPCLKGNVRHREGSGNFLLNGGRFNNNGCCRCRGSNSSVQYLVDFGANIAVSEGGTAGEISLALALDGSTLPESVMIVTPAAVEEYFEVSRSISVPVWRGCCETVTVRNTSTQPIDLQNGVIRISYNN